VERESVRRRPERRRGVEIALRVAYWLAVVIVSLILLVALILLLESRDDSSVDEGARAPAGAPARV